MVHVVKTEIPEILVGGRKALGDRELVVVQDEPEKNNLLGCLF